MKNCIICGNPLSKKGIDKGRREHYGCRMFKRTKKKSINVIQFDSTDFTEACKALDRNPELINRLFL